MSYEKVIDQGVFVVCSPRMPTPARSTGEGTRTGTRIEEVKQVVFTDEFLRPLGAIKSQLRRSLMRLATPIDAVSAWLVPLPVWDGLKAEIEAAEAKWAQMVADREQALDKQTAALCKLHPAQAGAIRANALTPKQFRAACNFVFGAFRLTKEQVLESKALTLEIGDLAYQVLEDLAKLVADGKRDKSPTFSASTPEFVEMLAAKAQAFAFVDVRVARVATELTRAVQAMPRGVALEGAAADLASSLFAKLMNPATVLNSGLVIDAQIRAVQAPAGSAAAPAQAPTGQAKAPAKAQVKAQAPVAAPAPQALAPAPAASAKAKAKPAAPKVVAGAVPEAKPTPKHNPVCV